MNTILITVLVIALGGGLLYGLHRLALHLENKGLLYYKHKRPSSSVMSSFVALHQMIEPGTKNVITVGEQAVQDDEDGDPKEPGDTITGDCG